MNMVFNGVDFVKSSNGVTDWESSPMKDTIIVKKGKTGEARDKAVAAAAVAKEKAQEAFANLKTKAKDLAAKAKAKSDELQENLVNFTGQALVDAEAFAEK